MTLTPTQTQKYAHLINSKILAYIYNPAAETGSGTRFCTDVVGIKSGIGNEVFFDFLNTRQRNGLFVECQKHFQEGVDIAHELFSSSPTYVLFKNYPLIFYHIQIQLSICEHWFSCFTSTSMYTAIAKVYMETIPTIKFFMLYECAFHLTRMWIEIYIQSCKSKMQCHLGDFASWRYKHHASGNYVDHLRCRAAKRFEFSQASFV